MSDGLMNRREFIKRSFLSGATAALVLSGLNGWEDAEAATLQVGSLIDLTRCDGCEYRKIPACVEACREANKRYFPNPRKEDLKPYWPQKNYEDWSTKQNITNRLTPYNWTFVQKVEVEHKGNKTVVYIPRRCMHCDNPPCAKLCPFSAQEKKPEGPVIIDPEICFGGAKCREVCPWHIPQRQAGVGPYLKFAPKFAGGGVMYKCTLCYDRILQGKLPACVEACPRQAISFGPKEEMRREAHRRAGAIGGYIYGEKENGGTSTFYVSAVPFEAIHRALVAAGQQPAMPVGVPNFLDTPNGIGQAVLLAPVAGLLAAGVAVYKGMKYKEMKGGE
ncbi:MAG: 4Fe-4S dicluster domain-containing protein [Thermanaeromonas sp.]|uniref:4Fe-4S dicluster domain-containing protein n=1 Tax=Thermanaeromonas sp. TaxID=2003697 RepID=UPI00243842BD|nr:4Fe-4S dicluster domain-containing protein [Thermanaeromonas sp.]MCG0278939.1 4Fe-4S dicluster domain-containing protein [Thermanaeromonas sp.]